MLVSGKDLLDVANANGFAVPAFNVSDYAMMNGLFEISEEKDSPLLIAIHPDELSHTGVDILHAIIARAHRSSVPVTIHLDHGGTYEQVLLAIKSGFTSVMIDGSMLPYDENVAITKRVVDAAHAVGVSVEGELGTIGKTDNEAEDGAANIIYTEPEEAVDFVASTGVDSLAIAIGTSHGLYPASMKPALKLDLLAEIKKRVAVPLVLHGGSNNPDAEIAESVKRGVNKINISSDIKASYHNKMREVLADPSVREPNTIQPPSIAAMKQTAAEKIDLFGSAGKAELY
ncbi:ketose-bisphosphate aldolase [Rathayibacter sp. VKM Ac-2804]|jgi:fructose-bisphosphate aldolase class II|uniref:ketose-bisphosphate aldolase n=1 Tax=unclassified Rathayibacter TaxID=2609250 RepID=UPI00132ED9C7|nr:MULTISPECIES: ketose-bisphosphate aldolase [unclassified Rathayibacter]NRG39942.1 ketose-bisphosphate aldolase [Rathayibacter sp. VKM Ac-2835]QHF23801.1 ketose-bisphosphate aldolase [Rathayibacter sp. VKM Ac-2804]